MILRLQKDLKMKDLKMLKVAIGAIVEVNEKVISDTEGGGADFIKNENRAYNVVLKIIERMERENSEPTINKGLVLDFCKNNKDVFNSDKNDSVFNIGDGSL